MIDREVEKVKVKGYLLTKDKNKTVFYSLWLIVKSAENLIAKNIHF